MQLSNAQAAIRMRNVALSDNKEIGYDVKMNGWWGLGPCSTQSYIALTHSTAFTLSVQVLPYLVRVEKLTPAERLWYKPYNSRSVGVRKRDRAVVKINWDQLYILILLVFNITLTTFLQLREL